MLKKFWIKIIIIVLIISFQSVQAYFGARPLGMGGAFTAISNDANAAYYNPAGLALNPGIDLSGGDNFAAFKMCFEVPMNPFTWIMGVGMASALAYTGAKYLYDEGIVKKNWGRSVEKSSKDESVAEKVEQAGSEQKEDVAAKAKEKAKETAKKAAEKTVETMVDLGKETAKAAKRSFLWSVRNPWYYYDYHRPTYWDRRDQVEESKAQFALGVSWIFDKNADKNQNTNWYSLTLASGYAERIALGANINIYDLEIPSVKARGIGGAMDLGVIARPVDQVAFGASVKDILTTDIHFTNGAMVTYGMNFNAGIALMPISELTLAADLHNIFQQNGDNSTMHYGIEYRFIPGAALRAGLSDSSKTAGLSFAIGPLIFDYAYLGGSFNRTQIFGATWKI